MTQQEKMAEVDAVRERLNRLHRERGAMVVEAKQMRIAYGVKSNVFSSTWSGVEQLTEQIEQAQRELDSFTREASVCVMPTLVVCELVSALDEIRCYPAWQSQRPHPYRAANYEAMRARADSAVKAFERSESPRNQKQTDTTVGEECQKVINRLVEGLELIAEMPAVDPALNIPLASVVSQYDEARETARLTLDQYARNAGIVVDHAAVESGEVPHA
jgi:hypothetical protein